MHKFLVSVALAVPLLVTGLTAARADAITFNISNKTGAGITTIIAAPKSGADPITLTTGAIATDTTVPVTFQPADGDCVFTLTTTLDSGNTLSNPDTDLCQTDTIVLQ